MPQAAPASHTNRQFYDRISHAYDSLADSSEHQAREAGQRALAVQPGEDVLEIGFGTGHALVGLARAIAPGGKVTGLDVSEGMRSVALSRVREAGVETNVELQIGDAHRLPFGDARFDAAFLSFTLELFEPDDIPAVLDEIRRVLKPGGRLGVVCMATVKGGEHESLLEKSYQWMHRHFPHILDCQPIDANAFLERAGFEITHNERLEIWTMPVAVAVARMPARG
jgi:demethylmenaquinone methyltransferase/2-methoxy-6-polyprenyl-1,4-benzoquinol methylase